MELSGIAIVVFLGRIMMEALIGMEFEDRGLQDFVEFYCEKIGFNYHGEKIGCNLEDEPSGKLNFNVGIIKVTPEWLYSWYLIPSPDSILHLRLSAYHNPL